jgi:acyl-CoA synthetase (AMP-forming)/AMP-acid ligase II
MNIWQFLAGLPAALWFEVMGLIALIIVLFFGGAFITLIKGGRVKVSKEGIEAETEEEEKK